MKTMENLTLALLMVAAALGISPSPSGAQEVRLNDLRAQQPPVTIYASTPCRRAAESPRGRITEHGTIHPGRLVPDLNSLMEKSDEVVLAGLLDNQVLLSPSGESTATYYEVRVIRSWKGSHRAGDVLTFGKPGGLIHCKPLGPDNSFYWAEPAGSDWAVPSVPHVYVLFLRQSRDDEVKSVQGLRLAAGDGVQGMFLVQVPVPTNFDETYCALVPPGSVQHCDSFLLTSQSPVMDPYAGDPLAKKYVGMPASDFLREIQSVAATQGAAKETSAGSGE